MRLDLAASELLIMLSERWPTGGHGQIEAELFIEDALKAVALAERERCAGFILSRIAKLRSGSAYSQNAANQLQQVIDEILQEEGPPVQWPDLPDL